MKSEFGRLKRKIILQVVLLAALAFIIGTVLLHFVVDGVLQAPFANFFISFFQSVFRLDKDTAVNAYQSFFRNYKDLWVAGGYCVLLFLLFYFGLSRFTRYFNEIGTAVGQLSEEGGKKIRLPPELDFLEMELNQVKSTLEKRERDAREVEQRKNDLVVYLAHDIKTPLTSVIGYLSLMGEAPDMPPEQRAKYMDITLRKALRLEELINEFFDITRFNLQDIALEKEEINLHYMLLQLADEFYPLLSPHGRSVEVSCQEGLTVFADPDKLARVFYNILKNAAAYSYENSVIQIFAGKEAGAIVIRFENEGREIPRQKLDRVFEKFYRLDAARSSNTGGAGLGLKIAKEIVLAHGGEITAQSGPEKTVFTVKLPALRKT